MKNVLFALLLLAPPHLWAAGRSSILSAGVGSGSITTDKLVSGSVTTPKLAQDAVTGTAILAFEVTTNKLGSGAVTASKLMTNAVTTVVILDGAVVTAKIDSGAITTAKLNKAAIVANAIDTAAVITAKIASGAVDTAKLLTDAVTAVAISGGAVTTNKIATDAVAAAAILASAVTTDKISSGAVVTGKLGADGHFSGVLGVGQTSPKALLHVGPGTVAPSSTLFDVFASRAGGTGYEAQNPSIGVSAVFYASGGTLFGSQTAHTTSIVTNGSERMFFDATSNKVGIGNTAPNEILTVTGDGRFTTDLTAGDALVVVGSATVQGAALVKGNFDVTAATFTITGPIRSTGLNGGLGGVSGARTTFEWIPSNAAGTNATWALRAGRVNGTQWDAASVGAESAAIGVNLTCTGTQSYCFGTGSTTGGNGSQVAIGHTHSLTGTTAMAFGSNHTAANHYSYGFGRCTTSANQGVILFRAENEDTCSGTPFVSAAVAEIAMEAPGGYRFDVAGATLAWTATGLGIKKLAPAVALDVVGQVDISSGATIGPDNMKLGGLNGKYAAAVHGIEYSSSSVIGDLTVDFTNEGLTDCSVAPNIILTPVFDSDDDSILACTPHTISTTGFTIECELGSGDGLTAVHAADATARLVSWMKLCPTPTP